MSNHVTLITGRDYLRDGTVDEFRTLTVCTRTGISAVLRFIFDGQSFWTMCHTCSQPLTIPHNDSSHTVIDLQDDTHLELIHDTFLEVRT